MPWSTNSAEKCRLSGHFWHFVCYTTWQEHVCHSFLPLDWHHVGLIERCLFTQSWTLHFVLWYLPKAQFNLFTLFFMLLPSRAEATAAHRATLVIVINNVWLIWLIKQSGNPLPVGNTTSSRITKITSELSALVTALSDKELDRRSTSKNTFMQCSYTSSVLVNLQS